ncbi:DUF3667 domain-containing protein [Pelagerythrobacter marensis]|uniref:DUF3667 domain-containing protein n=1 Tax=Pelagerythrobacter marensis TaxID=543877 RepID=A0A0G3XCL7_9SPHN|nr:DUF3667 domain-containing protein [Pelagerythrobacter marensis]AKM08381.1 hypothetical protein AM2010_2325 [Pelagerythrobacter marensis]
MAGDIGESMADIAIGSMAARSVEPDAGGSPVADADGHTLEEACLNCGTRLTGPHCHNCGQRAHVHRTLSAFFHDLLHGVLHFEGKTWRTLPLLLWKPGKLTREYIDGRRASYVSPIALFLFVVFLSFAVFSLIGGSKAFEPEADALEQVKLAYATNQAELAELQADQANESDPQELAEIEARIASLTEDQQGLQMVLGNIGDTFERDFQQGFAENPLPESSAIAQSIDKVRANPQLAIYKIQTNAYKFSWMLIPLSVPFVWLLFPFSRRFRGYDHTVFATYSITFMIALAAISSLLIFYGAGAVGGLLLLYAPWHMYRQLRGAYALGRFGALWRMLALSLFAWIAIGLFLSLIGVMAGT